MPVRFARLRIAGFKSFADATVLELLPGLTGVVGPNGCGKSNVIDALRWVMGEASGRALRGRDMEDVIFAGTTGRASRNFGEVTVTLEETLGLAPPPFQAEPELEITRRIERGTGSSYRVNGREARARDVATLFADFAAGSRNSALVSQGRVSALVSARPEERRVILEEAAGITGLHARRHEAELKLRAAEANLTRADDLRGQISQRLAELRKQAKQAARYKNLSGAIRAAEIEHLAAEHSMAAAARAAARCAFEAAEAEAARARAALAEAGAGSAAQSEALPALRGSEAEARTALERARIGAEQAAEAEARARAARQDAEARAATLKSDRDHAEKICRDAEAATARLEAERQRLIAEAEAAPALIAEAEDEAREAALALERAEAEVAAAIESAARLTAGTEQARRRHSEAAAKAQRARARAAETLAEHQRAQAALIAPARIAEAAAARDAAAAEQQAAQAALQQAGTDVAAAEAARAAAEQNLAAQRGAALAAETRAKGLRAEADALTALLAQKFGREQAPVLDEITVPTGLEAAIGAALRDDLAAGRDPSSPRHWRELPRKQTPAPALEPLAAMVTAPAALARALDHVLLLPEGASGAALQETLSPGQSLVSRDGALWRWDGFSLRAGAPNEAAARLAQRNHLRTLRADLAAAAAESEVAAKARFEAEAEDKRARTNEAAAREARGKAERRADQARAAAARQAETMMRLESEAERAFGRAAALEAAATAAEAEAGETEAAFAAAKAELAALPDAAAARQILDAARAALAEARRREAGSKTRLMQQRGAQESGAARLTVLGREAADWIERAADARSRLTDLAARSVAAASTLAAFATAADPAALKQTALAARAEAEAAHRARAAALAKALDAHESAEKLQRSREAALAAAREALVRGEGAIAQADHAWGMIAETILQRLGAEPELPDIPDPTPQRAEAARARFDRLTNERDEMGPVNLRAEIELAEVEVQIAAIERDRDDIAAAIAKLRGSIGHLNREGRERLARVFTEVDQHFQALFARMFGGGRAHLALLGDDPLQAGLEIYAQPPGKKLASVSLLSGGEQALTALSLIFAVFRCNPAPIAVLDEVDAPLDDANVDRFCTLLEDMVRDTGTRMLVVTHHHLTMARMDRLYGVTMQERGVSRLLSVDLGRAVALTEADAIAAQ